MECTSGISLTSFYFDICKRSTTVPLLKKRRTMTGINAAKSRFTSAIINAETKVKYSVKYRIEDEFKTLFKTVNPTILLSSTVQQLSFLPSFYNTAVEQML